ncbi:hypothetical protein HMH01_13200 [Halovulum dunhuangense]|uniref:Uncharacterized protein n=1 Tax=Halovulum dunhuangense TaxID=1505036 RepID=A0A849L557_9RHOB|nr:hypothetical protein [Halovulum dunhuangense]NNU81393.1 hypothetical protein [Halovulum dunhuangense]
MPKNILLPCTFLIASSLAATGHAEGSGALTLNLADDEYVLPLWSEQSDWSGGESWPSINIHARAPSEGGGDPLVVSLSFEASRWEPAVPELDLTRYKDGAVVLKLFAREEADHGALSVTLEGHEVDGSMLSLAGRFEGTMGTSDNFGRDIDLSDAVPVKGTFEVTLENLD